MKKQAVLIGILISFFLFVIAATYYPGGSQKDKNSIGYDWKNNYLCNLFSDTAINGLHNPGKILAVVGMFFLCTSVALFFIQFSKRIQSKSSANIIKFSGAGSMLSAFFAFTSYHDKVITVASLLALIALFYLTVFIFKSKLILFKFLSIVCLLVLYANNYIYYTQQFLNILPIMQKLSFLLVIIWMLGLQYCTKTEDFNYIKFGENKKADKL